MKLNGNLWRSQNIVSDLFPEQGKILFLIGQEERSQVAHMFVLRREIIFEQILE